eukprot:1297015-Prymnesium_polylepis.2
MRPADIDEANCGGGSTSSGESDEKGCGHRIGSTGAIVPLTVAALVSLPAQVLRATAPRRAARARAPD